MHLNRSDRCLARGEVRSTDDQTGHPRQIDACRFENPSRFLFRPVEHVIFYARIVEQFDRQRLPCGTSRAVRYAQREQQKKRDTSRHAGQRTHSRAGRQLFESDMVATG